MLEHGEPVNAHAQLVAEAVAAFNENNAERAAIGLPPMAERLFFLGHARHCHGRHLARVLQNSRHPNSVDSYSPWLILQRKPA